MGLFGLSKIKVTPEIFVETQLDKIFSSDFIDAETNGFLQLSKEIFILQSVDFNKYLNERQNVIFNLLKIAWDRNIPYAIFIEHSNIMYDDPRVEAMDIRIYSGSLSRAQQAGMSTFAFLSQLFLAQLFPKVLIYKIQSI